MVKRAEYGRWNTACRVARARVVVLALYAVYCLPSTGFTQSQPFRSANLNGVRFADQFPGANVTAKLDAAQADIGSSSGVLVATPTLGFGSPTTWRNNVAFLDLRQAYDPIDTVTDDPDRVALVLLENRLGDMTTRPVTGTVTLTNGSTAVTGSGTNFQAQLANHYGRSIKFNADSSTSWARIASVTDDTHATLAVPYPGKIGRAHV